ncbi:MAG: hypothetical protein M2R45_02217 [Verrucomicrobia subdivision 3 bacterium]|nr:hypothetical protein [Limisphaerales bacterium]MCS1413998.1 hypothetical protein [Limisphaerales bacterium]
MSLDSNHSNKQEMFPLARIPVATARPNNIESYTDA